MSHLAKFLASTEYCFVCSNGTCYPDGNCVFWSQVGLKYNEAIVIRITGCPNGCARPYMAELGFVGDGPNSYQVFVDMLTILFDCLKTIHSKWEFVKSNWMYSFMFWISFGLGEHPIKHRWRNVLWTRLRFKSLRKLWNHYFTIGDGSGSQENHSATSQTAWWVISLSFLVHRKIFSTQLCLLFLSSFP